MSIWFVCSRVAVLACLVTAAGLSASQVTQAAPAAALARSNAVMLSRLATSEVELGRSDTAILYALQSLSLEPRSGPVPEARAALAVALANHHRSTQIQSSTRVIHLKMRPLVQRALAVLDDDTVKLIDTSTGKEVAAWPRAGVVTRTAELDCQLATTLDDRNRFVRGFTDSRGGREPIPNGCGASRQFQRVELPLADAMRRALFDQTGKYIVLSTEDHIKLIDSTNGSVLIDKSLDGSFITVALISPDQHLLAVATEGGKAVVFDLVSRLQVLDQNLGGRVNDLDFADGGNTLYAVTAGVRLHRISVDRQQLDYASTGHGVAAEKVWVDEAEGRVYTYGGVEAPGVWDASSGRLLASLEIASASGEHDPAARHLFLGREHIVGVNVNGDVQIWSRASFQPALSKTRFLDLNTLEHTMLHGDRLYGIHGGIAQYWGLPELSDGVKYLPARPAHGVGGFQRDTKNPFASRGLQRIGVDGALMTWTVDRLDLWQPDGAHVRTIALDGLKISAVNSDPEGRMFGAGTDSGLLRLWQSNPSLVSETFGRDSFDQDATSAGALTFAGPDRLLAAAGMDMTFWSVSSSPGAQFKLISRASGHTAKIERILVSPDHRWAASTSSIGFSTNRIDTPRLWDVRSGKLVAELTEGDSEMRAFAASRDARMVASLSEPGTIHVWDTRTGKSLSRIVATDKTSIYWIAFSPDSRAILGGDSEHTVHRWDVATGKLIGSFRGHASLADKGAISPNGRILASGDYDGKVILWNLLTGARIGALNTGEGNVGFLLFSPDSKFLAVVAHEKHSSALSNKAFVFRAESGELYSVLDTKASIRHICFDPASTQIAAASDDGVHVWNVRRKQVVQVLRQQYHADFARFTADGSALLTRSSIDGTVIGWSLPDGRILFEAGGRGYHSTWLGDLQDQPFAVSDEHNVLVLPAGPGLSVHRLPHNSQAMRQYARSLVRRGLTPAENSAFMSTQDTGWRRPADTPTQD